MLRYVAEDSAGKSRVVQAFGGRVLRVFRNLYAKLLVFFINCLFNQLEVMLPVPEIQPRPARPQTIKVSFPTVCPAESRKVSLEACLVMAYLPTRKLPRIAGGISIAGLG
jgi:hypothetical protein